MLKKLRNNFFFKKAIQKTRMKPYVKRQLNFHCCFFFPLHGIFPLSCSVLNENKLFKSPTILTLKNTYVNCQEKIRYLLDFHGKKH